MERTPTSLKELAQLVLDVQDASARQVAERAEQMGHRITRTTISQMRAGTYKSAPKEETLRALAELANVSVETAFHAAGLPVPGPPLADELPPGADHLSPKSRAAVIQMVRVLIDLEGKHDDHEQQDHEHHEQPPARERSTTTERRGAAGGDAGAGQKTAAPEDARVRPEDLDLAAHPYMELSRDRQAREWGDVGEESQDSGDGEGA